MRAIDRKLIREVGRLKGQIITIALVLACGIMCFISLLGVVQSLDDARAAYYDRYRFAHVFAHVHRAPESIGSRIEAIEGVEAIDTRITEEVTVPIEGMERPAYGRLVSLPPSGVTKTNALTLLVGSFPEHGHGDEVVVLESFAKAHGLLPGHRLPVVINGNLRQLRVVGIALSPEFVYTIRPGAMMNDPQRYAVLWMERSVLAGAFDLEGAFNDVTIRLQPEASSARVRADVDRILLPYGNDGSIDREHQLSNRIVASELDQLRGIAGLVPVVFLGVAAFLVNLVLGRMIALQRSEIAALKAVGYSNREIAVHYLGLVAIVMVPGGVLGIGGGYILGKLVLDLYATLFRFPDLVFRMTPKLVLMALFISGGAAVLGALLAIRSAVKLPPAEAMRPPAPSKYRRGLLERLGLSRIAGPSVMMVVRELERRPLRSLLSSFGIAGAVALIIFGHFGVDSLDAYLEGPLATSQRHDLAVSFSHPLSPRAAHEIAVMPGVTGVEGIRAVPVRANWDNRKRDTVLMGLPAGATLRRLIDRSGKEVDIPSDGVVMTNKLGEVLGLHIGDRVELEVREGNRPIVRPVVVGFVDESVGMQIYGRPDLLGALEHDEGVVSSIMLTLEPERRGDVMDRLRRSPFVIDVSDLKSDIERLRALNGEIMNIWTFISSLLSACVVFGVVYNNARIALATRSRELASLRVLGLTRREISSILIGSLLVEVIIAIPIGLVMGRVWSSWFMNQVDQEDFRWRVVVEPSTYALAVFVTLLAAAASTLWVRRNLDRLDLIGVLKTRE